MIKFKSRIVVLALATTLLFSMLYFLSCRLPGQKDIFAKWKGMQNTILDLDKLIEDLPPDVLGIGTQGVMYKTPWNQISPENARLKREKYDAITKLMGVAKISVIVKDEEGFSFIFDTCGFAGNGYRLSFTHRDSPPPGIIPTIDKFRRESRKQKIAYIHLEDSWYCRVVW